MAQNTPLTLSKREEKKKREFLLTVIALKACDIVLIFIAQMGLKEDEYALQLLGFKQQIERISAAASRLVLSVVCSCL